MRIAFVTSMKGGLTQFIFRDIDALVRKGHHLDILTLKQDAGLYNPLPEWNVVGVELPLVILRNLRFAVFHPLLFVRLCAHAIRTRSLIDLALAVHFSDTFRQADLIFSYFGDHKLFVGYYGKRITGVPLVVTIRAYELYRNPNPTLFRQALALCDRVLTITEHNRRLLEDEHEVPAANIEIVRQIVDLDQFKPARKIKILIVGFFAAKKGHDVLFRAIKRLNHEDIELWVVGDATRSVVPVDCRQLAAELEIEHQVAFFGSQSGNALRALFRECDVFCLPSRKDHTGDHEGFPNAIAEAMAFGKPVVSTRHAGIPEAVDSILVDENDADQLADALKLACDSPQLRAELGARNRETAEAMFSMANNDRLEQILADIAGAQHPEQPVAGELSSDNDQQVSSNNTPPRQPTTT